MATAPKLQRKAYTKALGMPLPDSMKLFLESRANGTGGANAPNSPRTIHTYGEDIKIFVRFVTSKAPNVEFFNQLTPNHVNDFIKHVQTNENWSEATRKRVLRSFRSYLNWVKKDLICTQQGMDSTEMLKLLPKIGRTAPRMYVPSEDDMMTFINGFDRGLVWGLRNYVVALVLLDCGARCGEICNLNSDCILWEQSAMYINKGKTGERRVNLSSGVMPQLKAWMPHRDRIAQCEAMFPGRQGYRMNTEAFDHEWAKNRERTGVGDTVEGRLTPHTMRHYFCTQYLANGGSIPMLMQITGHTSISTLQVYLHMAQRLTSVKEEHARVTPVKFMLEGRKKRTFRT